MKVIRSAVPIAILQVCFFRGFIAVANSVENVILHERDRISRQAQSEGVIDDIFKIPITAIRQTANVAQGFVPEKSDKIENIFQIPIATLEAVGNLVKSTSSRRFQNADEVQRSRQEKRERILAEREQQRFRRERQKLQHQQQQQLQNIFRRHHRNPFGLNSLMDLLIGYHGKPTYTKPHGGHHNYEVHEQINEGHEGAAAGSFVGFFFPPPKSTIQNKVAPQEDDENQNEQRIRKELATQRRDKVRYEESDLPPENKIAPRNGGILFE